MTQKGWHGQRPAASSSGEELVHGRNPAGYFSPRVFQTPKTDSRNCVVSSRALPLVRSTVPKVRRKAEVGLQYAR